MPAVRGELIRDVLNYPGCLERPFLQGFFGFSGSWTGLWNSLEFFGIPRISRYTTPSISLRHIMTRNDTFDRHGFFWNFGTSRSLRNLSRSIGLVSLLILQNKNRPKRPYLRPCRGTFRVRKKTNGHDQNKKSPASRSTDGFLMRWEGYFAP